MTFTEVLQRIQWIINIAVGVQKTRHHLVGDRQRRVTRIQPFDDPKASVTMTYVSMNHRH